MDQPRSEWTMPAPSVPMGLSHTGDSAAVSGAQSSGDRLEVDRDVELLHAVLSELDGVEGALQRIDGGTYGRCATCGSPIADAVLEADPLSERCAAHP